MKKYRKKPVEIEAVQFRALGGLKTKEIVDWINQNGGDARIHCEEAIKIEHKNGELFVYPKDNDWIIKGNEPGDFYPCPYKTFDETYEAVEE